MESYDLKWHIACQVGKGRLVLLSFHCQVTQSRIPGLKAWGDWVGWPYGHVYGELSWLLFDLRSPSLLLKVAFSRQVVTNTVIKERATESKPVSRDVYILSLLLAMALVSPTSWVLALTSPRWWPLMWSLEPQTTPGISSLSSFWPQYLSQQQIKTRQYSGCRRKNRYRFPG